MLRGDQVDEACARLKAALENCTARQACDHPSGLHGALGLALHAQLCALLVASATGQEGGAEAREEAEEVEEEDSRDDGRGKLYSQRRGESDEDEEEEEEWTGRRVAARRPARRPMMGGSSSGAVDKAAATPTHDLAQGAEPMVYELPPELWMETAEAAVLDDEDDEGGASSYVRPEGGRGAVRAVHHDGLGLRRALQHPRRLVVGTARGGRDGQRGPKLVPPGGLPAHAGPPRRGRCSPGRPRPPLSHRGGGMGRRRAASPPCTAQHERPQHDRGSRTRRPERSRRSTRTAPRRSRRAGRS